MGRRTKRNHNSRNLKSKDKKKKKKSIRLKHILIAIVLMLIGVLVVIRLNQGEVPTLTNLVNDEEVDEIIALESENVDFLEEDGYILTPNYMEATKGIVIYGDKSVSPKAYVPLGALLAKKGYMVVIPSFTLNTPSKDGNIVDDIINKNQNIEVWAVVGHGDGGIAMSNFVGDNEKIKGAVFLASYPDEDSNLNKTTLRVVSISGTKDDKLDKLLYESRKSKLPESTMYVQMESGNYDNFANYTQDEDGILSKTEQQIQTSVQILNLMDQLR